MTSIVKVSAILSGGIHRNALRSQSWLVDPETIDDTEFIEICTSDYKRKEFLDGHGEMLKECLALRNSKVVELMKRCVVNDDPNRGDDDASPTIYRKTRGGE